jgi:hypothetical protein
MNHIVRKNYMKRNKILFGVLSSILILAMVMAACTTAPAPIGPTLTKIVINPSNPSDLVVGSTQQFTATGTFSENTTKDVTSQVTWASSDTSVATINASGLATGIAAGATYISALQSTAASAVPLLVVAPTPTATGTYSDGSTADITSSVTWTTSDTSVATVSSTGSITGVAIGTVHIMASMSGVISPSAPVNVIAMATPSSITIQPVEPASLNAGDTLEFTAFGTYTDGQVLEISFVATWASSNTSVATISSTGVVTAITSGTTSITASLNGVTSQAVILMVN